MALILPSDGPAPSNSTRVPLSLVKGLAKAAVRSLISSPPQVATVSSVAAALASRG